MRLQYQSNEATLSPNFDGPPFIFCGILVLVDKVSPSDEAGSGVVSFASVDAAEGSCTLHDAIEASGHPSFFDLCGLKESRSACS